MASTTENPNATDHNIEQLESATVRLVGDSGDGMQLFGTQLTNTSALAGNDVATFPDFPAEIRAPRGTRAGVSGFQVQFASSEIYTPGDQLDALVAMNPAALVTNVADLKRNGLLIVNEDSFEAKDLKLANCDTNPLDSSEMDSYRLFKIPMTTLTRNAVEELGLSVKIADRCRNFFAMGLIYWLYERDLEPTLRIYPGQNSAIIPISLLPTKEHYELAGISAKPLRLSLALIMSIQLSCHPELITMSWETRH